MNEVGRRVLDEFATFVAPRADAQPTKAGQLRAFLEANVRAGSAAALASNIVGFDLAELQNVLRDGQHAGEFGRSTPG
jgi:hypothetical protein